MTTHRLNRDVISPQLSRRGFLASGGALLVALEPLAQSSTAAPASDAHMTSDPTQLAAWLEIRADQSIVVRTGRAETGTGMSAFYAQVVAEELNVSPTAITLITGDTDATPDGGYSAGFLTGAANLRAVAAYTRQALLKLAAQSRQVDSAELRAEGGAVVHPRFRIAYGDLVRNQIIDLRIPVEGSAMAVVKTGNAWGVDGLDGLKVTGTPPLKPVREYTVVGKSHPMPGTPDKVTGKTEWTADVRLPGMLHARMIRPASMGSRLLSPGTVDRQRFPTARVVRENNLLAVVAEDEWEAIQGAQSVAANTRWSEWSGVPPSDDIGQTLRREQWSSPDQRGDGPAVQEAFQTAARTVSRTYEQSYVRHAPIGPFAAVADVKADGSVTVWTHSAHLQGLRAQLAHLLGVTTEKVTVRWRDQSGQYGRTTHAADGAEADAVILSQITGRPVRVQWSLEEDLAWSSVSPAWFSNIEAALDATESIAAIRSRFHSPHMFDSRLLGAILAGRPGPPISAGAWVATIWPYDRISRRHESAYAIANIGVNAVGGGLRGNIMRTPGQRQQNFALESLINHAATVSGADPIEYRLRHTTDRRLIEILQATAKAAGWDPAARRAQRGASATTPMSGRGVAVMIRDNAYWAGIADIHVDPATGQITVPRFTLGVDCGKIINPRQLDRCMKGGLVMGLGEALKEEVTFDHQRVTSTNWSSYTIPTMQDTPEIEVVQISRDDCGFGVGGEAANALAAPAVAAAVSDATGIQPHTLPFTANRIKELLDQRVKA